MSAHPGLRLENGEWFARAFPEADTVTLAEYRAARENPPPPPPDSRPTCELCGRRFTRTTVARKHRFCSRSCLRRWHYGTGSKARRREATNG